MHYGNTVARVDPAEAAKQRAGRIENERAKLRELDAGDRAARERDVFDPWALQKHLTVSAAERSVCRERLARLLDEQRQNEGADPGAWRPASSTFFHGSES